MKDWRRPRPAILRRQRILRGATNTENASLDGHPQSVWCDNDYLGLSRDPRVCEAMASVAKRYGAGASASPLITGYTEIHQLLEERLATFTGRDRALVFSAGYLTNLGTVQALAERGDTLIEDRLNHASLLDAARLSRARCLRYRHADAADAARLLQEHQAQLILTDGVFSMDGDTAPASELAAAARAHDALLLCDDAHGIGVLGAHGGGLLEEAKLSQVEVPLLVGTLGKALGAQGGFVAGPADLIEHLLQYARSYGYSTALAPPLAAAADCALELLIDEPEHRARLRDNIEYFLQCAEQHELPLQPSRTAIQPLILDDPESALAASRSLSEQGFTVCAIRPPTVPEGTSRLRITLSARHTRGQIEHFSEALAACCPAKLEA